MYSRTKKNNSTENWCSLYVMYTFVMKYCIIFDINSGATSSSGGGGGGSSSSSSSSSSSNSTPVSYTHLTLPTTREV